MVVGTKFRHLGWILAPLGAVLAGVFFFLPWSVYYEYDSIGQIRFIVYESGARHAGYCWIAFVSSVLVIASFLLFVRFRNTPWKIAGALFSMVGLVSVIMKYHFLNWIAIFIWREPRYGIYMTAVGFALAFIGFVFLLPWSRNDSREHGKRSGE